MHNATADLFADVLECLERVSAERLQPDQAFDRLRPLRQQYGETSIDLIWDDEAFDGSVHYDALIRPANAKKTISLSVCPDDELPWALRGLQRWRDSELLRVNDVTMAVEQAITQLDVLWDEPGLMQRLIDSCIVTGELQRRDVQVSKQEVQAAFDSMRRRRGLFTTAALQAWMQDTGMSRATLDELAVRLARTSKLRSLIVGPELDEYVGAHRADFDEIKIAVLEVNSQADALRVFETVRQGTGILAAAHSLFMADARGVQVSFRREERHVLAAEFDASDLSPGATHLCARDDHFLVIQVLAVQEAQAGPMTTERAKARLFQQWLAAQRSTARIEWFWGDTQRTMKAG
jgi:putative peptide maturation system protein